VADGVLLAGPEGRVVFANEAAADIFGVPRGELLAPLDSFPRRFRARTPEDALAAPLARRALRGEVAEPVERHIRTPAGEDKTVRSSAAPVHDDRGIVIGAIVLVSDITADKLAEQERARLAAIVESSDDAIVSKDLAGIIRTWNAGAERLFGYAAQEAVGRPIAMLLPPDRLGEEDEILRKLREGDRVDHFETKRLTKDGRTVEVSITVSPLRDRSGAITGASKIARDITERKRYEDELRQADRHKTEFLGVLSHELRNPLAPIRTAVHLLDRLPGADPRSARARAVIRRQTEHLARLVDDLLDVTRISRGKIQLQRAVIDLREVVRRTTEDHRVMFDQGEIELRLELPSGPVWADVDATRIAQILGNLLQNAIKFTPAHGATTVTLRAAGGRAELLVHDTGVGMQPESVARVFQPFVQEERNLARTRGGLGLGLALAKGLIELHGGTIEASSEGVGRGSEFRLALPLASAPGTVSEAAKRHAFAGPERHILVIEDNLDAAETLAEVLELEGHRVDLARDGASGIAMARELKPDIVICDLGLPDIDGYEVARVLRLDAELRSIRLIALSGYAQPEDKLRAREAGFDAHLGKPSPVSSLTTLLG
jgi:PAS domain S-box-containing protein